MIKSNFVICLQKYLIAVYQNIVLKNPEKAHTEVDNISTPFQIDPKQHPSDNAQWDEKLKIS